MTATHLLTQIRALFANADERTLDSEGERHKLATKVVQILVPGASIASGQKDVPLLFERTME